MTHRTQLHTLAQACWDGACNPHGLLRSLGLAMADASHPLRGPDRQDVQIILEHLLSLVGPVPHDGTEDFGRYATPPPNPL